MEKKTVKRLSAVSHRSSVKRTAVHQAELVLFAIFTACCVIISGGYSATTDEMVDGIQKKLSGINSYKGTFTQVSYLKDLEKTETYAGMFFIKKPSGIMWEYKAPRDEKVIINGTETWIYKKAQKQAIRTRLGKEAYGQVPIALLKDMGNLRTDYEVTLAGQDTLHLVPKSQMGTVREIFLRTDEGSFPVRSIRVLDLYGNIITIELADVKTNCELDDSLFVFTAPLGVEVFDLSQ